MKIEMNKNGEGKGGRSSSTSSNNKIRIAVFGQHDVGKSALTVRYLTKRYIGKYKSNTVSTIDMELKKMDPAKEAVEQAIEVKVLDLDIVNEIMSIREQRRGNDYVMDEAQLELTKETCIIKDARNLLEKKGQEAWHQIARLQEVRQHILRDLSEKILALDIDRYLLNLNESSTEIAFRPDPLRIPKGMMTPQAWEEQSRYNKLRADNELATSVKLRESMLLTIDQTYNDIRSQREITDFAMRKRLHEMIKTGDDLQHQRQKILQEMCKVEREIRDLEDALLDKTNKMKLAETRLEFRTYRFGVELTRDDAQYGLSQEVLQLRAVLKALQAKINDAKKALNMLQGFLQTLESEIENKSEAKVIEQMALDVRGRVAASAETPLTKTERNIALSATVPVPEDRRKQSGEMDLLYTQTLAVSSRTSLDIEIVDISTSFIDGPECTERKTFPVEEIHRADGFVIVYSILDRSSFSTALQALADIQNIHKFHDMAPHSNPSSCSPSPQQQQKQTPLVPVLLIGNKSDLGHLRRVDNLEGVAASEQYGCQFYELSVAENSPEVYQSFQALITGLIATNLPPPRRKFSVSKMLTSLRLGRSNSPSKSTLPVPTSPASISDTNVVTSDYTTPSPNSPRTSREGSPGVLKGQQASEASSVTSTSIFHKLTDFHSIKKRQNSPPICSL